jgi:copper chaperone CopZ
MRLATALALTLLLVVCCGEDPSPEPPPEPAEPVIVNLEIEGMHCENCVNAITGYLLAVDGVVSASVDLASGRATVVAFPTTTPETLIAAIRGGYEARLAPPEDEN